LFSTSQTALFLHSSLALRVAPELLLKAFELNVVANAIWDEIKDLDMYIAEQAPFKKVKVDADAAHDDLRHVTQGLARIAVQIAPIMPDTSTKIIELIKTKQKPEQPLFLRKE
jgi:methionyl-tRNA synthetase